MEVRFKVTYAGVETFQANKIYDIDKSWAERLIQAGEAEEIKSEKKTEVKTATKKV